MMIPPGPDPENNRDLRLVPGRFDAPPAISDPELRDSPGCGIAAYGLLLLCICGVGMTVGGLGTLGFIYGLVDGGARGPSELKAGVETPVYQLKPLRDTRLVGLTEVPLAFHDESEDLDGSTACALMSDRLIRVADGAGLVMSYAQIDTVEVIGDERSGLELRAAGRGPDQAALAFSCHFRAGEGGVRMAAQLQAEHQAARPVAPAPPDPVPPAEP